MSFSQQITTGASADGDYVYYNAVVVNNTVATTQQTDDPNTYFQDTRIIPIIKDSSKYVLSVDNFTINGGQKSLPIFIPQIAVGSDVNLTIYTVSFGWQDSAGHAVLATIPLTWIPENKASFTVVPSTATPNQLETDYYYCYSYQHWLDILNNALTTAWRDVMYKVNALGVTAGTTCPFFEYDPNTGLFSLCQDANSSWVAYGTTAKGTGAVTSASQGISDSMAPYIPFGVSTASGYASGEFSFVGMNSNLEGLMTNFDTVYYGGLSTVLSSSGYGYAPTTSTVVAPSSVSWTSGTVYYPENVINVIPDQRQGTLFTLNTVYPATNAVTPYYIRETQDFISTGSLWSPIASLVLTTSSIPVRLESNASPLTIGSSNAGGTTSSSGVTQKVLIETPINAVTADLWRGFIDYKPLTPLYSALDPVHDGIQNLDVAVFWRNRLTNKLIPFKMYNGGSMSIRLKFVKK